MKLKTNIHCALLISLASISSSEAVIKAFPTAVINEFEHSYSFSFEGVTEIRDFAGDSSDAGVSGGSYSLGDFSGSWDAGDTIRFRIEAPSGKFFKVNPYFSSEVEINARWVQVDGFGEELSLTANYENFFSTGSVNFTETIASMGSAGGFPPAGDWVRFELGFTVDEETFFSAIEMDFTTITSGSGTYVLDDFVMMSSLSESGAIADAPLLEIVSAVPEPSDYALLFGLVGVVFVCAKKRKNSKQSR